VIPKNCFKLNGCMEIVKQNNGAFMWACRIWKRFSSFQLRSIAIFCSCPCEACTCVYSILAFQGHYHWKTMENDENTHAVPPLFSQSRMSDHVSLIFSWSVYLTNTAQISPSLSERVQVTHPWTPEPLLRPLWSTCLKSHAGSPSSSLAISSIPEPQHCFPTSSKHLDCFNV
jgi:hypothetical protein